MARRPLSALLDRFRRGVAVPAAVGDDLASELAPVFASLERFELEAEEIRRLSARRAERRLEEARELAAEIAARWREEAEAARAEAARAHGLRARDAALQIEERGLVEAERIRQVAARRIPELVAEIVRCVERSPG